jgi:hypothetical protein
MRSPRSYDLLLLAAMLVMALIAAAIWYRSEGHGIVRLPFSGWFAEAKQAGTIVQTNALPVLYLDIALPDYREIERQRDEALQKGFLYREDEDGTRAQVRFQDETVPVRIWLRGDWADPLQENKWPFQVQTDLQEGEEKTILGMRSFSLQSPAAGWYLNEWLYMEELRRAGILAPRYRFVNLAVNGTDWGVYALQEDISPEWLVSQDRPGGLIVHLDSTLFWRQRALSPGDQVSDDDFATELAAPARVEADGTAPREQRDAALGLVRALQRGQLPISQVFDADQLGRYIALTNLWGARNGLEWYNERYYYHPLTSKLEPIGYGAFAGAPVDAPPDLAQYDDLDVMRAYAREVERIARPEYLDELRDAYAQEYERVYLAVGQEFASMDLEAPWSMLPRRQERLLRSLHPLQTVYAYQAGGELNLGVSIQICNLTPYPVALQKLRTSAGEIDIRADWIAQEDGAHSGDTLVYSEAKPSVVLRGVRDDVPEYITLHIPSTALDGWTLQGTDVHSDTLHVVTHLVGVEEQAVIEVRRGYPAWSARMLPAQPSVKEALACHPFLRKADRPGFLEVAPGTWRVEGDLILPRGIGLRVTRPVTLAFDRDAILFSTGPLSLYGPDDEGIHLVPQGDRWGGLVVLGTGSQDISSLYNVEIRATSGVRREGWMTSGGVTFYQSPVVIDGCFLRDAIAQEAFHAVRSDLELVRTRFEHIAHDALGGDFIRGRIEQCAFHDIRGNGIDLSGSRIDIRDVSLTRVYGRGISAGESSLVTVENARTSDTYLAVVSRDRSLVDARNVRIARAWEAGFAAYQETIAAGIANLRASRVTFEDDSVRTLVQKASRATIDGDEAAAGALDIDALQRRQRTLAAMHSLDYRFGSQIRLVGYEIASPEPSPGDTLVFTLYWQALAKLDRDYTIFVHVLDAEGQVAVGWDNMPCLDACPTTHWRVGRLIEDTHVVPLPADMRAGEVRVALGVYYLPTGERLPVRGPGGSEVPDQRIILEQTIQVREQAAQEAPGTAARSRSTSGRTG